MEIASTFTARYVGSEKPKMLDTGVSLYFQIVLFLSIIATAFLFLWSDFLISIWLQDPTVVTGVRGGFSFLIWAIVPFTIFHSMKGIVEMNWTTPYNLLTLSVGIFVQIVSFFVLRTYIGEELVIYPSILLSYLYA